MRTSDVYLSAALLALGYKLVATDRKDPRHMVFEFDVEPATDIVDNLGSVKRDKEKHNLSVVETAWVNRTLSVNAFDFAESIKRMKSLIHSG